MSWHIKDEKNTLWLEFFVVVRFLSWFKYSRMKINHIWASQGHFVKSDMVVTLKFWPLILIFQFTPKFNLLNIIGVAQLTGSSATGIYCGRKLGVNFFPKEITLPGFEPQTPWLRVGDSTPRTQHLLGHSFNLISVGMIGYVIALL